MVESITIKSFSDYLKIIEEHEKTSLVLYRGQSEDDPLLPAIARKNPKQNTLKVEEEMLEEIKRFARIYTDQKFDNDWEWLALAQHYGMATRLLDWTTNPLIALWFASRSSREESVDSVIWIFNVSEEFVLNLKDNHSPFKSLGSTLVFKPAIVERRLDAQSSWFTAHKHSLTTGKFVELDKNRLYKDKLVKVIIPKTLKKDILKKLNKFGVNEKSIFLGLEGLCKYINWAHIDG